MQHDLVTEPFEHTDGWVYPPTKPGLGIEVIEEVVEGYRSEKVLGAEQADGIRTTLEEVSQREDLEMNGKTKRIVLAAVAAGAVGIAAPAFAQSQIPTEAKRSTARPSR